MPGLPIGAVPVGSGSFNGFAWGPGTKTLVIGLSGIDEMPPIRSTDAMRDLLDGEWAGTDRYTGRDITLAFLIRADATLPGDVAQNADAAAQLALMEAAFVSTDAELPLLLFNNTRLANVRLRKRAPAYECQFIQGYFEVPCLFHATDPRIYENVLQSVSCGLPVGSGGVAWPAVWPWNWGGPSVGSSVSINNTGNEETFPVITINGPTDNITVTLQSTGEHISLNISLAIGDVLVLDFLNQTILFNGSSRAGTMSTDSVWFSLPPGISIITYSANTIATGSTMIVTARSASV